MQYKKYIKFFLLFILLIPCVVLADNIDDNKNVVAREVKYYKTVTTYSNSQVLGTNSVSALSSFVTEITEEEYNAIDIVNEEIKPNGDITVGTSYSSMESTIKKDGNYYAYKAVMTWKTMPVVKSYDIMGIGYYASVKASETVGFFQDYCMSDGNCYQSSGYWEYVGSAGVGAMFNLPSGVLKSLKQTLYVEVTKTNSGSTIVSQVAAADYANAKTQVSYSNAKKFTVGALGITLDGSIDSSYLDHPTATATWSGTW